MIYNDNIDAIIEKATVEIKGATSLIWIQQYYNEYLGQNGILRRSLKSAQSLPTLARDERVQLIEYAINKLERLYKTRTNELKMVKK